jgi:hypothetical protein
MPNTKSNVFCPNCSAKNKIEQNFCRFCGLNLQETTKSLAAQLEFGKNARELKQLQLIKKLTDYGSVALTIIVSIALAFYVYAVLTKMIFSGERILLGLLLLSMVYQFVMRHIRRLKRNKVKENNDKVDLLLQRETEKLLEVKPFTPVNSVTENATKFLFVENKTNKLR